MRLGQESTKLRGMPAGHKWKPIEDLPADWKKWADSEMVALKGVLDYYREHLDPEALKQFNLEQYREWAIETGQIEGVYRLDDGITETFIKSGIDAALIPHTPGELDGIRVAEIIQDHLDALEGVFEFVKSERVISTSYIKELHQQLLRSVDTYMATGSDGVTREVKLEKGKFKTHPNHWRHGDGSLHEYCPPEHVDAEMDRLVAIHNEHIAKGVPPEITVAWLHHCFTQIHPFPDGNGRVARALASAVLIKAGIFPFVVTRRDHERYVESLRAADEGRLGGFIEFTRSRQRMSVVSLSKGAECGTERPAVTTLASGVPGWRSSSACRRAG